MKWIENLYHYWYKLKKVPKLGGIIRAVQKVKPEIYWTSVLRNHAHGFRYIKIRRPLIQTMFKNLTGHYTWIVAAYMADKQASKIWRNFEKIVSRFGVSCMYVDAVSALKYVLDLRQTTYLLWKLNRFSISRSWDLTTEKEKIDHCEEKIYINISASSGMIKPAFFS